MRKTIRIIHWLPRVICILAMFFISLFAADSFSPELTFWQQITGFLMHLIPSFILTAILVVAWKWEFVGGIIFTVLGVGLSPIIFMKNYNMNHSIEMSLGIIFTITIPFVLVGILFITSHFLKNKNFYYK